MRTAIQKAIKSYNGGWEAMASALGLPSVSALENRVYEKKGQELTFHQILMIEALSNTKFITEAMAARHNSVVIELPEGDKDNIDLFVIQSELQSAVTGVCKTVADSVSDDGIIDQHEENIINNNKTKVHKAVEKFTHTAFMIFKDKSNKCKNSTQ